MMDVPLIEVGRTVERYGCFEKITIYYLGWIHGLGPRSEFIYSGIIPSQKETKVKIDCIWPQHVIDVVAAKGAAA